MRSKIVAKRWLVAAVAATAAMCIAAPASQASSVRSSKKLTTVRVALVPSAAPLFIVLAQKEGFLRQHGLKMDLTESTANSTFYAALLNGTYNFINSTQTDFLNAILAGYPVRAVPESWDDAPWLVVPKAYTAKSLNGKTVGVPSLTGIQYSLVKYMFTKLGIKNYTLAVVPFDEQVAELEAGKIQVADINEPFLSEALLTKKYKEILNPTNYAGGKVGTDGWFTTSASYASSHRQVIKDWEAAVDQTMSWIPLHPKAFRKVVKQQLDLTSQVAKHFAIAPYNENYTPTLLHKYVAPLVAGGSLSSSGASLSLPGYFLKNYYPNG